MKIICDIIGSIFLTISIIFSMGRILNFSIKNQGIFRIIFAICLFSLYLIASFYTTMIFLRYLFFIFAITLIFTFVFRSSFKETLIASFFTFILIVISEFIFAIILGILNIEMLAFSGVIMSNIGISLILLGIVSIPKILNILRQSLTKLVNSKKYYSITLIVVLSLATSIIVYINYFNISSTIRFLLSIIVIIVYMIVTVVLFAEKNNNNKMQYEYENVLKNLDEYEKMLDFQRVANHENKNQLLVIKGMINKKEKNVNEYIDSIINEDRDDNEEYFYKTNIIPSGGLRGLVYYKTLAMKEKNIDIDLNILTNVRKVKFEKNEKNINKDLCKVMGIILDNAIQAVENLEVKKIQIKMQKKDDYFEIIVSNNFEGPFDLGKIDNIGYTTKGKGHGYGLTLLKNIIDKNEFIKNQKFINGNVFTQKILVKI